MSMRRAVGAPLHYWFWWEQRRADERLTGHGGLGVRHKGRNYLGLCRHGHCRRCVCLLPLASGVLAADLVGIFLHPCLRHPSSFVPCGLVRHEYGQVFLPDAHRKGVHLRINLLIARKFLYCRL
ncbi:unnamed protein product [Scytosiphon promiscuus]